jgi:hypothetical protein
MKNNKNEDKYQMEPYKLKEKEINLCLDRIFLKDTSK